MADTVLIQPKQRPAMPGKSNVAIINHVPAANDPVLQTLLPNPTANTTEPVATVENPKLAEVAGDTVPLPNVMLLLPPTVRPPFTVVNPVAVNALLTVVAPVLVLPIFTLLAVAVPNESDSAITVSITVPDTLIPSAVADPLTKLIPPVPAKIFTLLAVAVFFPILIEAVVIPVPILIAPVVVRVPVPMSKIPVVCATPSERLPVVVFGAIVKASVTAER